MKPVPAPAPALAPLPLHGSTGSAPADSLRLPHRVMAPGRTLELTLSQGFDPEGGVYAWMVRARDRRDGTLAWVRFLPFQGGYVDGMLVGQVDTLITGWTDDPYGERKRMICILDLESGTVHTTRTTPAATPQSDFVPAAAAGASLG